MLGCEELATDQRFASNTARVGHRLELIPLLADRFAARTSEDLLAELLARGIPAGVIRGVRDALAAAAEAGDPATVTVAHPTAGTVELVRSAIRPTGMSLREPEPPPLLGEHTREVLLELGMTEAVIRSLEEDAVVGAPPSSG
jgi:crotonobetainyl-CoA:carnitine CoA-transferase CaiB-like acyl-CoA transferase